MIGLRFYGKVGGEMVEGVVQFKYLGRPLDQTDDDWPAVRKNINRAWKVWGILRKILKSEGADIKVSVVFYRLVVQLVILFDSYYCVLSAAMDKMVEEVHPGFLCQITGERARRNKGDTWVTPATW